MLRDCNSGTIIEVFGAAAVRKVTRMVKTLLQELVLQGFLLGLLFHSKNGFAVDVVCMMIYSGWL